MNYNSMSIALLSLLFLSSCSSKPILYPNQHFKSQGKQVSEADISKCIKEADEFLDSSKGKALAKSAGFGAVVGGTMGAVTGLFFGDVTGGAARGAAIGGAGGAVSGSLTPDEIKHHYVNKCLSDQGYHVMGWD
jgi:hypothetical protein